MILYIIEKLYFNKIIRLCVVNLNIIGMSFKDVLKNWIQLLTMRFIIEKGCIEKEKVKTKNINLSSISIRSFPIVILTYKKDINYSCF